VQLLNVTFGGTLYQDISTQLSGALVHRDWEAYDHNHHDVDVAPGGLLAGLYGVGRHRINSVHHQAIKDLAAGLVVEARCPDDGVIEAVRWEGEGWVHGVQWHPEFHVAGDGLLDPDPLMRAFLDVARDCREER
jgi:putative glutamine amidotransferase